MESSFLTLFCRPCQAPRFRSIKPLAEGEPLSPSLFKPLDPETPTPSEGKARCHLCDDPLVIISDKKLLPTSKQVSTPVRNALSPDELFQKHEEVDVPQRFALPPGLEPERSSKGIEILFEVQPGEEVKSFNENPTSYLMITNKRVVRVPKG